MLARPQTLAVHDARIALAGRTILQEVTFALEPGEVCGLIGANGSGKTTLLRAILGFVKLASGRVDIAGEGLAGNGMSRSVGYVPQTIAIDPMMPLRARDLVALGLDGNRLFLPWPSRARRERVDEMLEAVDATGFADQRLGTLSGGQQQRILIAHARVRRPRLLLLDEPLASLDIGSVAAIVALLRRLSRALQTTVLLSAHDMNPLLSAMDRIVYLANGRAASGTPEAVARTEVLSRLYGYHVDVLQVHGRILVVAADGEDASRAALARHPAHATPVP